MSKYLLLLFVIFLSGCTSKPDSETSKLSPNLLGGTENIYSQGERNLSISPNGRWLSYFSSASTPFDPQVVLYDLSTQTPLRPSLSLEAHELVGQGRGPLNRAGCWDEEGNATYFPSSDAITLFVIRSPFNGESLIAPEPADQQDYQKYFECLHEVDEKATKRIEIHQVAEDKVALRDKQKSGQVIAEHVAERGHDRVDISNLSLSPSKNHIAYTVDRFQGSFVDNTESYLVNLENSKNSSLLDLTVGGPILWAPNGLTIYAVGKKSADPPAVYQWELPDETQ